MLSRLLCSCPLFALFILCSCQPQLNAPPSSQVQPIINGETCGAETHPSAVAIIVDAKISFLGFPMPIRSVSCTGTLIAPDTVMTAAHCVNEQMLSGGMGQAKDPMFYVSRLPDLSAMSSGAGGALPPIPEDAHRARARIANPGFDPKALTEFNGGLINLFDVALIFLEEPVEDVQPAVLITSDEASQLQEGREVEIVGWGQSSPERLNPFVPPPPGISGIKICAATHVAELGEHEMQIGDDRGSARKCHGDSGGPTYMQVETPHALRQRVVGITSHAYDKTDCLKGGVDTRVDAWLGWIEEQMVQACAAGQRSWCEIPGIIPPDHYDPQLELAPDQGLPASDGAAPLQDGAVEGDAAPVDDAPSDDGGCGCVVAQRGARAGWGLLLLCGLVGLLLARRRRS